MNSWIPHNPLHVMTGCIRPRRPHSRQLFCYPTGYSGVRRNSLQSSSFTTQHRVRKGQTEEYICNIEQDGLVCRSPSSQRLAKLPFSCPSRTCTDSASGKVQCHIQTHCQLRLYPTNWAEASRDLVTRCGCGMIQATPRPLYPREQLDRAPVWIDVKRKILFPCWDLNPEQSSPLRVAVCMGLTVHMDI
jgi:hypothetical protein